MTKITRILPFMTPIYDTAGHYAAPVLRVTTGLFLIPHGAQKLFGWFGGYGLEATGQYFESIGLSNGFLVALSAGSVEFFGGMALALGLLTRISAMAAFVLLAVAISIHLPNGFMWTDGGLEYPLMWAVLTLFFIVKGGGTHSVDRLIGKEF